MSMLYEPVAPTRPAAPYVGGKRNLAKQLVALIAATPHQIYAEPFVGMGGVFLRRTSKPRCEAINDWSQDVSTFFRILQRHYVAFVDMLRFQLTTRAEFERLKATDPSTLTDLERAARFLYLQRTTYGGLRDGGSNSGVFSVKPGQNGSFDPTRVQPMLEELHARLSGVVIERLPFQDFIRRYDRPETLFFIDPPYWGLEGLYGKELFARSDYEILVEALRQLKGRFILTINDRPETRELFSPFDVKPIEFKYSVGHATGKELLVTGGGQGSCPA